jgi:hypothetical protein
MGRIGMRAEGEHEARRQCGCFVFHSSVLCSPVMRIYAVSESFQVDGMIFRRLWQIHRPFTNLQSHKWKQGLMRKYLKPKSDLNAGMKTLKIIMSEAE